MGIVMGMGMDIEMRMEMKMEPQSQEMTVKAHAPPTTADFVLTTSKNGLTYPLLIQPKIDQEDSGNNNME